MCDIGANIGFAVCAFTAGVIVYEFWRGMRVRHRHGEPYLLAFSMLIQRYRQRYGGYLVHLGLVVLAVGVIGSHFFQVQQDADLKSGQAMQVAGYRLVFQDNLDTISPNAEVVSARMQVWQGGRYLRAISPGRKFYPGATNQPVSEISIISDGLTDLYVFLADWNGANQATIRVFVNPLVPLFWMGGLLILIGGLICWWPARRRRETIQVAPQSRPAT